MMIDEILAYNKKFVEEKRYEQYAASKYPNKKIDFQKVSKEETLESSQTAYNVLLQIYLFVWKTSFEGMKSKTYIRFC